MDQPAAEDPQFVAACAELRQKPKSRQQTIVLGVVLFVLFYIFERNGGAGITAILILMAVLFVHELGHLAAMRGFGYQDVRIFFLPGFGAVTSGRKEFAPAWQQAIVSLAGPVPGIVLALAMFVTGIARGQGPLRETAWTLLVVNAINLFPVEPLDGGKFLGRTLFSRAPIAEAIFSGTTSALLVVLAVSAKLWFLAAIAFFVVLGTGARIGEARSARLTRERVQTIPPVLTDAPREYLLLLYAEAYPAARDGAAAAVIRAARMRNIHALVAAPATNVPTIIVLVGAYFASGVLAFITLIIAVLTRR